MILGLILAACIALTAGFIAYDNSALETDRYIIECKNLPKAFDGFKIVQISDLHNKVFGKDNSKLLNIVSGLEPDIVVMTGDLIDSRHTDRAAAYGFCQAVSKIAPAYFAAGNHEGRFSDYAEIAAQLKNRGVNVLDDDSAQIERDGQKITLFGYRDPRYKTKDIERHMKETIRGDICRLMQGAPGFKILLAHRPEFIEIYANAGADLVFSGHAHGGQFRFPGVGGLLSPGQGFFPVYDAGVFEYKDTKMVVSRGLGNSSFPFRYNNRPEVVEAVLRSSEK